jgi:hypothetical protein
MNVLSTVEPGARTVPHTGCPGRSRCFLAIGCMLSALAFAAIGAHGQTTVTLAWSNSSSAAGYYIYQGTTSRYYTSKTNVGKIAQTQLGNLLAGTNYFFAVAAYNSAGVESAFSSEVSYTPQNLLITPPPVVSLTTPVTGDTFLAAATINLAATVVATNHVISQVQFYAQSRMETILLGQSTLPPYVAAASNLSPGTYTITARAVYDGTNVADSLTSSSYAGIQIVVPDYHPGVVLAVASAAISAPFTVNNTMISQPIQTTVLTGGRAAYNFTNFFPGNYVVTADVKAPNSSANSFFVNIDAEPTDPMMIWNLPVSTLITNQTVTWQGISDSVPNVFFLSAGTHQLIVRGREANAQLGTITITPAPFRVRALSNKQIVLSGVGVPNYTYTVLGTTDLNTWSVVGNVTTDATGSFSFTDVAAPAFSKRYYRLRG